MRTPRRTAWFILASVAILIALSLLADPRPGPRTVTWDPLQFSAERALEHLQEIAARPHPVGSAEHQRVRDYLSHELNRLGAEVEVQSGQHFRLYSSHAKIGAGADYSNVIARLPGSGDGTAILLDAHYDSVFTAPGANDDGVGVAVLLECLRALTTGPQLRNDVIVMLSDAEEVGLIGADAFAAQHPWAKDVGLVINLEARGSGGPPIMFQTSEGNSELIRAFAAALSRPVASSLTYEIYKLLPNDTNFSIYRDAGWPGYDFAFIDGVTAYHTALDSLDNVEASTVQHFGEATLSLCRTLGDRDLETIAGEGDAAYFDLLGRRLVAYPATWSTAFACAVLVLTLVAFVLGLGHRAVTATGILGGFLLAIGGVLGSMAAVAGLHRLILMLHPQFREMVSGDLYNSGIYALAYSLLAIAITTALVAKSPRRDKPLGLALGALLPWIVLTILSAIMLPGASYVFIWPAAFAVLALIIQCSIWPEIGERGPSLGRSIVLVILTIPAIVILAPLIALLFTGLTLSKAWVIVALVALTTTVFSPQIEVIMRGNRWLIPGAAVLGCVAALIGGSLGAATTENRPRPNSIRYELDTHAGEARWVTYDSRLDQWTEQFFTAGIDLDGHGIRRRSARAQLLTLKHPRLEFVERESTGASQRLHMRVWSPRDAPVIRVSTTENTVPLRPIEIAGTALDLRASPDMRFDYHGASPEGFKMVVEIPAGETLEIQVEDRSFGLPEIGGLGPRSEDMIAKPFGYSDLTIVRHRFRISPETMPKSETQETSD